MLISHLTTNRENSDSERTFEKQKLHSENA